MNSRTVDEKSVMEISSLDNKVQSQKNAGESNFIGSTRGKLKAEKND